jgi:hypothetical protein
MSWARHRGRTCSTLTLNREVTGLLNICTFVWIEQLWFRLSFLSGQSVISVIMLNYPPVHLINLNSERKSLRYATYGTICLIHVCHKCYALPQDDVSTDTACIAVAMRIIQHDGPGYLGRYSDWLRAGRQGFDSQRFLYPQCPDWLWGPASLLSDG